MRLIIGVLILLFGLKLLSSPLFTSLLAVRLEGDVVLKWIPSFIMLVAVIVVGCFKIHANAQPRISRHSRQDDDERDDLSEHADRHRHERRPGDRNHWRQNR